MSERAEDGNPTRSAAGEAANYDAWYRTPRGAWIGECEFRLLERMLQPRPGELMLDVGCGTGYFTRRFATAMGTRVIGLDPDLGWLSYARDHAQGSEQFVAGRAERLPLRDASVDRTLCVTALCFVPDQRQALREMVRVTRTRLVLGLLNRHSLLYMSKGRRGGTGAYRGAHWHTPREVLQLFDGLPVRNVELRSAIYFPAGAAAARVAERLMPDRCRAGAFLVAAVSIAR